MNRRFGTNGDVKGTPHPYQDCVIPYLHQGERPKYVVSELWGSTTINIPSPFLISIGTLPSVFFRFWSLFELLLTRTMTEGDSYTCM